VSSRSEFDVRVVSPTEQVNPRTVGIDEVSTLALVRLINDEDARVPGAVAATLPVLAELVDAAYERVRTGGRVHYFGAGTSGRLGVLDAAELLPTFGVVDDLVIAHQAGGSDAVVRAVEGAEDDELSASAEATGITGADVVIGLTASGRTPYVGAALAAGRAVGAATALVTSNPQAALAGAADFLIATDTGPEAIAGSTRLKAGSALKLVLNTFSTALMVRLGHTYQNLMVDMLPTNAKLRGRSIEMLRHVTGASDQACEAALDACGDLKTALVYLLSGSGPVERSRQALERADGRVRDALKLLGVEAGS
jgi:N-acetylmuramic acid 6-phosphate etherase